MSKDIVSDSLGWLDEDMIQSVEVLRGRKRRAVGGRWAAMAACFCLVAAAAVMVSNVLPGSTPIPPDVLPGSTPTLPDVFEPTHQVWTEPSAGTAHTEVPRNPWSAYFNEATDVLVLDGARVYIPGYFTEELRADKISALEPGMRHEWMQYAGYAGFDGNGQLVDVHLTVTTTRPDTCVTVAISENGVACSYRLPGEPVISVCGDVEYQVYQWTSGDDSIELAAQASIEGNSFSFALTATPQTLDQAKEDFTRILECFAYYADGKPDLDAVTAEAVPEWFDQALTHAEALADPSFGAYMLPAVPEGFSAESIRRYKDQEHDYLSGLWTRGYDELQWKVYTLTDADERRLTGVGDTRNYDLSLYPIPRADSVPEELREIVDNPIFRSEELTADAVWARAYKAGDTGDSDGWRMMFSVKYGNTVVEVRAKGVDPDWIYQQLMGLIER